MLSYVARTLPVLVRALARRESAKVSRLERRVGLGEIDLNRHMNQAVYAQVFELGRADWFLASGFWNRCRAVGVNPVVAEQRLVYRRELGPIARYAIDTRAVAVDGRLLALESWVLVGDRAHTRDDVKLIFVKAAGGVLAADEVSELCRPFVTDALPVVDWRVSG